MSLIYGSLVVLALASAVAVTRDVYLKLNRRLPPGPPPLPILGNVLQIPSQFLWYKLEEWSKQYGPIFTLWIMGNPIVILSGVTTAADVLDRRSGATADRLRSLKCNLYFCSKILTFRDHTDPVWKAERRALHANLNINAAVRFYGVQTRDAAYLVLSLLEHPEKLFHEQIHRYAASIIFRSVYGGNKFSALGEDPSRGMEKLHRQFMEATLPHKSVVDTFPFLAPIIKRVKWFRKKADDWHEQTSAEGYRLYAQATDLPGGESTIIQDVDLNMQKYGLTKDNAVWSTTHLYMAGQDTTHSALRVMGLAMLHYPDVMAKAQQQLDAVCGARPPSFGDRNELPYISALVKETIRWRPGTPIGAPHKASEDIVYNGFVIPSGTPLLDNIWSQTRDSSVYGHAEVFEPERFLDKSGQLLPVTPDTRSDLLGFGHGRRVCPGRDFALNAIFIASAYLLWAFNFENPLDAQGNPITSSVHDFEDRALTSCPKPYGIVLRLRRADASHELRNVLGSHM